MSYKSRYPRLIRRKITQEMLDNSLRIDAYAKKYNYSVSGIHQRINTKKLIAFKWGKALYIVDKPSPLMPK